MAAVRPDVASFVREFIDPNVPAWQVKLLTALTDERKTPRLRRVRRMWSMDGLPMPRAWFYGPKWKRLLGVVERPIAEIDPEAAKLHRPGRKLLIFTLEDDVRELVTKGANEREEVRPGVFAEW